MTRLEEIVALILAGTVKEDWAGTSVVWSYTQGEITNEVRDSLLENIKKNGQRHRTMEGHEDTLLSALYYKTEESPARERLVEAYQEILQVVKSEGDSLGEAAISSRQMEKLGPV